MIISESLKLDKCESCKSLKNEVTNLHKILEEFTKGKYKLDLIISNQKASFNKNRLGYKPLDRIKIFAMIERNLIVRSISEIFVIRALLLCQYKLYNMFQWK